jgi:ribosome-associated protein
LRQVKIKTDFIQLDQFLKWANIVETGGQAKMLIKQGYVTVNGEQELRRSRKLKQGDVVMIKEVGKLKVTR